MRLSLRLLAPGLALALAGSLPAQAAPASPAWEPAPSEAAAPAWQVVNDSQPLAVAYQPLPATRSARELAAKPADWVPPPQHPVTAAVGGGLRIGFGEPTYGMAAARLGVALGEQIGVSIRPGYVFGNSDQGGQSNGQGAWQIPITMDLLPTAKVSPYIGAGVATNTDSTGDTNAMLTGGLDINMTRHLSLGLVINYIFQSTTNDNNGRDIEGQALLFLRL